MTAVHRRAVGVSDEDESAIEEAAKPADEREQSEADKLVDQMRRTYERALGLPEDEHENRESDDSAEWPLEKEDEQARATARTSMSRGAR